ncbi:hypothetical protein [Nannocystis punicea]|uniref:F5/8 type C domain-containing protein n=1 Tax=Nannocystis punicea TaxID=2995304 RepID=A0ABY7HH98_9BACT|nr:hypothetical protein [Nannocystis poenicansa]WAS98696.1 hypothetical protein O0S08_21390 [Nannocystis poenicansa]
MLGASRPTPTLVRLSLVLAAAAHLGACAGGDPGIGSTNPFDSQGNGSNATPGTETGQPGSETDPTPTAGGSMSDSETTAPTGPSSESDPTGSDPTGDPTPGTTTLPDPNCVDDDGDLHGEGCSAGPDCDDASYNSWESCGVCVDADMDGFWVGCDQYGPDDPGPDCDDANPDASDASDCECAVTPPEKASDTCAEGMPGALGVIAEGGVVPPIKGSITGIDNGPGNGQEDWYWVEFPEAMAMGNRPNAGKLAAVFAVNPGDPANPDYRFEVYTACNKMPFEGLNATYGPGTPPAREWEFFDAHTPPNPNPNPNPNYLNNVPWPAKVFIRVIRVANDQSCSEYTLQVSRLPT